MRSDERTFTALVRRYQQPLYGYIRRLVLHHEDAEDILQETFAKAFRKLWQVRSEDAVGSWLYKIATNEVRRHFRNRKGAVFTDEIPDLAAPSEMADAKAVNHIMIPRAISTLTPLEREVFCLKYYEDMDYETISRITGSSVNSLTVTWHHAKNKIKEEILK